MVLFFSFLLLLVSTTACFKNSKKWCCSFLFFSFVFFSSSACFKNRLFQEFKGLLVSRTASCLFQEPLKEMVLFFFCLFQEFKEKKQKKNAKRLFFCFKKRRVCFKNKKKWCCSFLFFFCLFQEPLVSRIQRIKTFVYLFQWFVSEEPLKEGFVSRKEGLLVSRTASFKEHNKKRCCSKKRRQQEDKVFFFFVQQDKVFFFFVQEDQKQGVLFFCSIKPGFVLQGVLLFNQEPGRRPEEKKNQKKNQKKRRTRNHVVPLLVVPLCRCAVVPLLVCVSSLKQKVV